MAIETLRNVKDIGGYKVIHMDDLREIHPEKFNASGAMDYQWFESEIRPHHHIYIRHDKNSLTFTLQNGPVKENGVNGCQVDEVITAAMLMIEGLDDRFPCKENKAAIFHLQEALYLLNKRREEREARGVEGKNEA